MLKKLLVIVFLTSGICYGQTLTFRASKLDSNVMATNYRVDTAYRALLAEIGIVENMIPPPASASDSLYQRLWLNINNFPTRWWIQKYRDGLRDTVWIAGGSSTVVQSTAANLKANTINTSNDTLTNRLSRIEINTRNIGGSATQDSTKERLLHYSQQYGTWTVLVDSNKLRKAVTIDAMPDSIKLSRKFVSVDNFPDSTKSRKNVNIDNRVSIDTTAIGYSNRLREQQLFNDDGLFKCDTMTSAVTTFLTHAERDTTKKLVIDFLSIATDSLTVGYELWATKMTSTASDRLIFANKRLIGNAQVVMNFIGSPLVLNANTHLRCRAYLPTGQPNTGNAKTYLTIKYRVR